MTSKSDTAEQEAAKAVGIPKVSKAELDKARREGAIEAAKEDAKAAYRYATDGQRLAGDSSGPRWPGRHDIMQWADLIDLGIDEFRERVKANSENPVPEEKVAGLLELERSGQNRTPYVKAMMERLGVKSPYEVTAAGPDYTNDVAPVTKLSA